MKGNDYHRRDADAVQSRALIKGYRQRKANAREWLHRAREAFLSGNETLAARLYAQAALELQGQH